MVFCNAVANMSEPEDEGDEGEEGEQDCELGDGNISEDRGLDTGRLDLLQALCGDMYVILEPMVDKLIIWIPFYSRASYRDSQLQWRTHTLPFTYRCHWYIKLKYRIQ